MAARLPFAVVTLLTTDSYLPGALTAIHSLLDIEGPAPFRPFETVCLVTPSTVSHDTLQALEKVFDRVVGVEEIVTQSWTELDLLGAYISFCYTVGTLRSSHRCPSAIGQAGTPRRGGGGGHRCESSDLT